MRSRAIIGAGAAAALAIAAGGCGPEPITLPEPPRAAETAQLVATYDMPTATLDLDNIDQVRSDAQARMADLHLDWLPDLVSDLLTRLRQRVDAGGLPDDPMTVPNGRRAQLTAVANLHRVCAGWDNPAGAPDEAANGALDVTAIVDTGRLNPEIWGTATACRARFPPADTGAAAVGVVNPVVVNATVDGTLIVYLLGPLPSTAGDAQLLVSFDGSIGVSDQTKSVSFDFEIFNGSVRFRVPVGGGDAIVTVGTTLGIKGANAGFSCDLSTLTCQSSG